MGVAWTPAAARVAAPADGGVVALLLSGSGPGIAESASPGARTLAFAVRVDEVGPADAAAP